MQGKQVVVAGNDQIGVAAKGKSRNILSFGSRQSATMSVTETIVAAID
jgi:hypothetical protein